MVRDSVPGARQRLRLRQATTASLIALSASAFLNGSLAASSTAETEPPPVAIETAAQRAFPSSDEISAVTGVELEASGIQDGLSQLWEGIDFDPDEDVPSAQIQIYRTPEEAPPGEMLGVVIDIVDFGSVEDAVGHVDEVMFTDYPPGFAADLSVDYLVTNEGQTDDGFTAAFILVRNGPFAFSVWSFGMDAGEIVSLTTSVAQAVLSRLPDDE